MKKRNFFIKLSICLLIASFMVSCYPDDPDNPGDPGDTGKQFELDKVFSLEYQETKINDSEGIDISFNGINSDSRCPVEVICVWAGNAEVQLTFSKGTASEKFILNTGLEPSEITAFGYLIKLENLVPPASTDNPPAQGDYITSLIISKSDNGCIDNTSCPDGSYCRKKMGDCGGTGTCVVKTEACTMEWAPVCGCNNATYGNSCSASAAGVNINYSGECGSPSCDDGTTLTCKMMIPVCSENEMLAVQNSCWVCVNQATCKPWGEPACSSDSDCAGSSICDPCGTSSCPFCDDCLSACVSE